MQKARSRSRRTGARPARATQAPVVQADPPSTQPSREAKRRSEDRHSSAERNPSNAEVQPSPPKPCGCDFTFNIKAAGDIHINNYCAPPEPSDGKADGGQDDGYCRPADGTCIPVVAGAKHKQGRSQKMSERSAYNRIPSVLAASTMHAIRRYVGGASPADALEQKMFATMAKMPKDFLRCTVDGFDAIPPDQRVKLFAPLPTGTDPLDLNQVAADFAREIRQRSALAVLGDPLAADGERPGQNRLHEPIPEDYTSQVRICRVNQFRTSNYIPGLQPADYLPAEYQQDCTISIVDGTPESHCELRTTDCPGNTIANVCARVVDAAQGDTVELEGVNFFNVEAKVRLVPKDQSAPGRDVDGFVWGDVDTPLDEMVGTETWLIRDCRVHDRLIFEVPKDLPANLYEMRVAVPNDTGNPAFGAELVSDAEYLNVLPSPDARYQIMIKKIRAIEETSPTWAGSDEVGLRTIASAMNLAGELMPAQVTKFTELDGVEFDSGTHREPNRAIFESDTPILGLVIAVMGHEIDSEWAYNRQVDEWSDYFIHLLEVQKEFFLAIIAGSTALTKWFGWKAYLIGLAAAGIVVAFDLLIAIWGPADPIIDDLIDLSVVDLDLLVSPSTPIPPYSSSASELHIRIHVNRTPPPPKLPYQYTELREYLSAPEMSNYELTYQYNRLN